MRDDHTSGYKIAGYLADLQVRKLPKNQTISSRMNIMPFRSGSFILSLCWLGSFVLPRRRGPQGPRDRYSNFP